MSFLRLSPSSSLLGLPTASIASPSRSQGRPPPSFAHTDTLLLMQSITLLSRQSIASDNCWFAPEEAPVKVNTSGQVCKTLRNKVSLPKACVGG